MRYVFDTSAIIALLEICGLGNKLLVFSSKNELYVPQKVKEEYFRGYDSDASTFVKIFSVVDVDLNKVLLPYFNFDRSSGEIWVISHACNHPGCCCVIDEEFGRRICKLFHIKLTGSIGIIHELKNQAILSNDELHQIRNMIGASRFYLSRNLLKELDRICSTDK